MYSEFSTAKRGNGLSFRSFVNANSKQLPNIIHGEECKKAEKNKNIKKQHFTNASHNIINHVNNVFKNKAVTEKQTRNRK